MKTIWKFPLKEVFKLVGEPVYIELPIGLNPLTVQLQDGEPVFWAMVDTPAKLTHMAVTVVFTGHPMPESDDQWTYIGTVQLDGYVRHVFVAVLDEAFLALEMRLNLRNVSEVPGQCIWRRIDG